MRPRVPARLRCLPGRGKKRVRLAPFLSAGMHVGRAEDEQHENRKLTCRDNDKYGHDVDVYALRFDPQSKTFSMSYCVGDSWGLQLTVRWQPFRSALSFKGAKLRYVLSDKRRPRRSLCLADRRREDRAGRIQEHAGMNHSVPLGHREQCAAMSSLTVSLPVLPRDGPMRLTPTDVSQFVRLEQCERYLRFRAGRAGGAEVHGGVRRDPPADHAAAVAVRPASSRRASRPTSASAFRTRRLRRQVRSTTTAPTTTPRSSPRPASWPRASRCCCSRPAWRRNCTAGGSGATWT